MKRSLASRRAEEILETEVTESLEEAEAEEALAYAHYRRRKERAESVRARAPEEAAMDEDARAAVQVLN